MDTRLTELLPKAMGVTNGDAKLLKNAGAMITDPFDSIVKSILVGLWKLGAEEVIVVGHRDCGMTGLEGSAIVDAMKENGIDVESVTERYEENKNLDKWLSGFDSSEANIRNSVNVIKKHPLLPKNTRVHGLIIDPGTGKLDVVVDDNP